MATNMFEKIVNSKSIQVYDNLFSYGEREAWFDFISNSYFSLNGNDSFLYPNQKQLVANYNELGIQNLGITNSPGFHKVVAEHKLTQPIIQARVNAMQSGNSTKIHQDGSSKTFLYYANLKWELDWGGHTIFTDDNLESIEYTCVYKPGRVVVFDGMIPHMISTPSIPLNEYPFRFSYAMQFV